MESEEVSNTLTIYNDIQTRQYTQDVTTDNINISQPSNTNVHSQTLSEYSVVDDEFLNELMSEAVQVSDKTSVDLKSK